MELSLNALVEQLDDLFFARATRAWRVASGVQPDAPEVPELPQVARLDAWQHASEVLGSPRVDDAKRTRVTLLRRHLARAFVEARLAPALAARAAFEAGHTFFAAAKTWTPREATRALPRLAARVERDALEQELSLQQLAASAPVQRGLDEALAGVAALQLTPETFVGELHGRPLAERLAAARRLLQETADASNDLLAFALKRVDPALTPRTARLHDVRRAALAPWLFEWFRREDLSHAVSRTLGDLGFNPSADGRVTVDTEPRPGRDPRALCVELRVPDQVRLLLTAEPGLEAWGGWLQAWGVALHRAHVGRALPFVERRLGDRAVVEAIGRLFESLLLEEGWLKRYARLTATQAKEAARLFAWRQLLAQREAAARALYSAEVLGRGAFGGLRDEYVPRLSAALGVEVPAGAAAFDVDPFGDDARALDAWALADGLRGALLERFNEDYYRNPATGRWLTAMAAVGQRDDAVAVAKGLGLGALDAGQAARRRVQVMGA